MAGPEVVMVDAARAPRGQLQADAIGLVQDTVIGMASAAPAATVGLTLAALASATAYGAGAVMLVTVVPMLVIANAYRRLNLWNANCGAAFEWVGRAINPYLGFMTGWLMLAAYTIGGVGLIVVLGPSVLSIVGADTTSVAANLAITTVLTLAVLAVAVAGIKLTARTQIVMAVVEYGILVALSVAGLVVVLGGHRAGTVPVSAGWLSLSGIGGKASVSGGFLVAVAIYAGWDGSLYVNEEVKGRRVNPGRAVMIAVALLAVVDILAQVGLQGLVPPGKLQANAADAPVYVAGVLGGPGWAKAMAAAIALSVVATTGVGIVLTARIIYGMAAYRVLPPVLANVSPRFATPVAASVLSGVLLLGLAWVYTLGTSLQSAFNDVVSVSGWLFGGFYVLTGLAVMVYYRRRITASAWDALTIGLLPAGAVAFLGWTIVKSVTGATAANKVSLAIVVGLGLIMMIAARVILRPAFFHTPLESAASQAADRPPA